MGRRQPPIGRRHLAIALGIAGILGLLPIAAGCGSSDRSDSADGSRTSRAAPGAAPLGTGSMIRNCDVVFDGPGPADWRRRSAWIGPFGLAGVGPGPDFAGSTRESDGLYRVKTPTLIAGHRRVRISLPRFERDRAGLLGIKSRHAYASVTYVPCADKPRTVFAAGFVLRDTGPVKVSVEIGGEPVRTLEVGRSELRERVLGGVLADLRVGSGARPESFGRCLVARMRRSLTGPGFEPVVAISLGEVGAAEAAQRLNRLAAPIGDRCGGRRYVPELIFAGAAAAKG